MPRVKGGFTLRRRRKKLFKLAKGYTGVRGRLYRIARETVDRALNYAYRDRRVRKREFRQLWIARISAGARSLGISYSQFMLGIKRAHIILDRKSLSELAINDFAAFTELVKIAKSNITTPTAA
jgi:large subunit ribosomal protein L20